MYLMLCTHTQGAYLAIRNPQPCFFVSLIKAAALSQPRRCLITYQAPGNEGIDMYPSSTTARNFTVQSTQWYTAAAGNLQQRAVRPR